VDALALYDIVADVMLIERQAKAPLAAEDEIFMERIGARHVTTFVGRLYEVTPTVYQRLDDALRPFNLMPLLRETPTGHALHILHGRLSPPHRANVLLPLILFLLTVISVLYTGTLIAIGELGLNSPEAAQAAASDLFANLWRGWPYALSILLILGAHEAGHWVQMRRYGVASSLPYFLPAFGLSPLGTFGAGILLKEPMRNRRVLFDVGAAGPWLGALLAVPILLMGLAGSPVVAVGAGVVEGNSILYWLAKVIVFGRPLPDGQVDVLVNQVAWAGWTGLFVTALNLLPVGQLDGGHTLYALLGYRARALFSPVMGLVLAGALFFSSAWVILGLLIAFLGRSYAVPLDDVTPLDPTRRRLAVMTLGLFVLCIVPIPLAYNGMNSGLLSGLLMSVSAASLWRLTRG
jgi:Zn-dependent protease